MRDWDSIMLQVWVCTLVVCTILLPINVAIYLAGWIGTAALIVDTLILSYVALQLTAAGAIVAAIAARRVKALSEGEVPS